MIRQAAVVGPALLVSLCLSLCLTTALVAAGVPAAQAAAARSRRPTAELATNADLKGVTAKGGIARLVVRVTLPRGLHVQANKPRDPNLIPTVLTVEPATGSSIVDIAYPKVVDFSQAGANQPLAVYPNVFDIVVRLKVPPAAGTLIVPATLRYQACDAALCFPPAKVDARWTLVVPKA